jgi:hypothetical protein
MIEYILAILATYRVARMLALEEGAFGLFEWVRVEIGGTNPESTWLSRGLHCPLCISFWIALLAALLLPFASWQIFVLSWLGIAGGAVVLFELVER